ncbi:MAG TPA: polyphenol oxidase family protein [Candidatus Dormibacteraeota bacterium]|nr:polyphenol oxidase family protein [Candidatus Dormibacteraeota bacterium]
MKTIPAVLHVPELADEPALIHGFSTTLLGSLGLTHAIDRATVMKSRDEFARLLELDGSGSLTVAGAVHGADVARVDSAPAIIDDVDALITDRRGIGLFTTHADCFPIVLWDPIHAAVGLAHAGWRGTHARVAVAALDAMEREFGTKPRDVRAGIGPGICGRCYEVGPEVAGNFDKPFVASGEGDRFLLDLAAANMAQLKGAGVRAVHDISMCTKESYLFPSHRRLADGTRFGAIVALR